MIIKQNLKDMDKVSVGVGYFVNSGKSFPDGKRMRWLTVYDADAKEVLKVIEKAIKEAN